MKNKLCYLVDIIENNEDCVILKVKDNKALDLIKLGCFNGDEKLIRLTKGKDHTCTIFGANAEPFSWEWGMSGYTLVTDRVSNMRKLIEECITEDFDIYIDEDKNKVRETMNIMSLDDSSNSRHFIEMMYWKNGNDVSVHKDDSFYKSFQNIADAKKHFEDLNYKVKFKNKYIAGTGCIVEEYDISKNNELENWEEEPYFLLLTDLNELNDEDSFTVARVINGINCVELHYNNGVATIEYGTRVSDDEWEDKEEAATWFNKSMDENSIYDQLMTLFKKEFLKDKDYEL